MFFDDTTYDLIARGTILTAIGIVYVIALTRIVGLRSFSKMTNFDFVITVASGTVLAGMGRATDWQGFAQAAVVMFALFAVQLLIAKIRKKSETFEETIQNDPVLLMIDGRFCTEAMSKTRVSRSDIIAKLRESNTMSFDDVRAVVLETTGDISVLHGDNLDPAILEGVDDVRDPSPELQKP
ncbi:YetF domain-containing protein [Citromicrobium bathyomarinum]